MNGRRVVGLGTAGLLVWVLGLAAAVSAHPGAVAVAGSQVVATGGACPGATFVMSGDLEGCWTTETFDTVAAGPHGIVIGRGTETFVGCIGSRCGTISFTFTFVGKSTRAGSSCGAAAIIPSPAAPVTSPARRAH
ncbi:MAG: hypothetical protein AB1736_06855 [Chloroflexota bacterium]